MAIKYVEVAKIGLGIQYLDPVTADVPDGVQRWTSNNGTVPKEGTKGLVYKVVVEDAGTADMGSLKILWSSDDEAEMKARWK